MDAARLNFSHGTHEDHAERMQVVREISKEVERPIAIIADLQGPKVRIGDLPEPVTLDRGDAGDRGRGGSRAATASFR